MKKILTIMALLVAFVTTGFAETWTVAGSSEALFGNTWDPANEANDMNFDSDTGLWTLTKSDVTLNVGEVYKCKVVKNHSWDVSYPAEDVTFSVGATGVYSVTVTYNPENNIVSIIIPGAPHTYTVAGSSATLFGNTWNPEDANNDMAKNNAGLYEWSKSNVSLAAGNIEFKVVAERNWALAYPNDNYILNIPLAGNYDVVITFNDETREINATASASITSILLMGTFDNWSDGIALTKGTGDTYTGTIPVSANGETFCLKVNEDTWVKYGVDAATLAEDYDFVTTNNDNNFVLSGDYESYAITATWTPSANAGAGWTLTIVPGDERPKYTYTATFVNGAGWENVYAYIWKVDGDNNVKLNGDYPGQKLVKSGTETISTVEYDVYTFKFETYDATAVPEFIVFSDGGSTNKTADLEFENGKKYTETVPENATINSVLIHGAFASDTQWANALTLPLTGSENVYSQTVPLTTTLQDLVFELQVNDQNVRFNDVTIDPASTELLVDGGGNEHFILFKNSTSGHDTYLATATWTPNPDPKAGWTLKVVGVHERTLDYAIVGDLTGGWPATTDDDGSKDVSMTAQNNGLYTLVVDEFAAEATTYEYRLRTNKMWNLFDLPGDGNASWTPTEAGNYKLTFVANVTGAAITDDTFGEIPAYTVTVVPEKIVVIEDYYVIADNGTKWVALGKMNYYPPMGEYNYTLDNTWTGKYFAIAPASALNSDGDVVDWSKVVRPETEKGNWLVELRQYSGVVVINPSAEIDKVVWEKSDEITNIDVVYYINQGKFALYPNSEVTISSAGYATYSNEYAYQIRGADVEVSIVTAVTTEAVMTNLTLYTDEGDTHKEYNIPAGTGVIVKGTGSFWAYPYATNAFDEYVDVTGNMLIGSCNTEYVITGNDTSVGDYTAYILAKPEGKDVGFYILDGSDNVLAAHKAFLAVPKNQTAPDFIGFGGTTGINSVERGALNVEGCYTLDGRRVENPTKGLYIINGKKVVIK